MAPLAGSAGLASQSAAALHVVIAHPEDGAFQHREEYLRVLVRVFVKIVHHGPVGGGFEQRAIVGVNAQQRGRHRFHQAEAGILRPGRGIGKDVGINQRPVDFPVILHHLVIRDARMAPCQLEQALELPVRSAQP